MDSPPTRFFPGTQSNRSARPTAIAEYEPAESPDQTGGASDIAPEIPMAERLRRCLVYLGKLPPAIQGQNGSKRTYHAACICLHFGLDGAHAMAAMHSYNQTCRPLWTDAELEKKLRDAYSKNPHDFGIKLNWAAARPAPPATSRPAPPPPDRPRPLGPRGWTPSQRTNP